MKQALMNDPTGRSRHISGELKRVLIDAPSIGLNVFIPHDKPVPGLSMMVGLYKREKSN